jgi:hypothetical protein
LDHGHFRAGVTSLAHAEGSVYAAIFEGLVEGSANSGFAAETVEFVFAAPQRRLYGVLFSRGRTAVTAFSTSAGLMDKIATATAQRGLSVVDTPLTAAHRNELVAARDRSKVIRKAARVAGFNGWTTALIAAVSAMFLVFDRSSIAIMMTAALSIVAVNEFRGRKRLLNYDPGAATLLGWNQLGLLAAIIVYCLWMLHAASAETSELSQTLQTYSELGTIDLGEVEGLYRTATNAAYGGAIALSVLFQGGNALYYFTRRRHLDRFLAETPEWVREVQRTL